MQRKTAPLSKLKIRMFILYASLLIGNLAQELYPKPTVDVSPGTEIVRGGNVTIRCTGIYSAMTFLLIRNLKTTHSQDPPGTEAMFVLTDLQHEDAGLYSCRYHWRGAWRLYSELSDPIWITVREPFPKPTVVVSPVREIVRGGNLTIRCTGIYSAMTFLLIQNLKTTHSQDPPRTEAMFVLTDLQHEDAGTYFCRYHRRGDSRYYSDLSDPVQITVREVPKPSIFYETMQHVKGSYDINCSAPQDKTVKRFFLYKDGEQAALMDRTPSPGSRSMVFPISGVNAGDGTGYRCSYEIQESRESVESPLSDPIQIGKDFTQGNIVQIVLTGVVLLILTVIITEHCYSSKRDGKRTRTKHYQND